MEQKMTFEEAMAQIDKIIQQLESSDIPLDQMIALYEKGMALSKQCMAQLDEYDARIETLQKSQGAKEEE
jgi:exodeoxyribonuclease VII small subunit